MSASPIPEYCVDANKVFEHIDKFAQDDVDEKIEVIPEPQQVFHLNAKTVKSFVKQQVFRRQLKSEKIFWAAFPEARHRDTGIYEDDDFVVATAACDDGGFGGCTIYLNRAVYLGKRNGDKVFLKEQNTTLLHADHRRIIVNVCTSTFTMYGATLQGLGHHTRLRRYGSGGMSLGTCLRSTYHRAAQFWSPSMATFASVRQWNRGLDKYWTRLAPAE